MPAWSSIKAIPSSKALRLSILLVLLPLVFQAQTLTGLWTGALHNDSNTVRRDQSFEIALTEYNGKVYGYSRSEFIVDDTLYYILKRVKGTIEGDICEVKDDEIISYNFRGKLDKGIRVTSTFRRNQGDSTWYLDGTWKTNATKKYYSVSGKVNLSNEKDLTVSKLFPHLEELNLAAEVAFYAERPETAPVVKIAKPEKLQPAYSISKEALTLAANPVPVSAQPADAAISEKAVESVYAVKKPGIDPGGTATKEIVIGQAAITPAATTAALNQPAAASVDAVKKAGAELPKTTVHEISTSTAAVQPGAPAANTIRQTVIKEPVKTSPAAPAPDKNLASVSATRNTMAAGGQEKVQGITAKQKNTTPAISKANAQTAVQKQPVTNQSKSWPAATTTAASETKPSAPADQAIPSVQKTAPDRINQGDKKLSIAEPAPLVKTPVADITEKAAVIAGRKSEFTQIVNFKSDSVVISLYDNGEIDGDTVSVFLNGEMLLAKQGLKSSAIKKTIYINQGGTEDFTLVMFAESLGKYPPNTGLLVIRDGDDVYNLRFSSDFQKNAGIVFRKKK